MRQTVTAFSPGLRLAHSAHGWVPSSEALYWFYSASPIANVVLAVRLAILLLDGTVRGPLIVVAPLLVGVPATLNVVSAAFKLRWGGLRDT